jgi:hypothetical protein
VKGAIVAI